MDYGRGKRTENWGTETTNSPGKVGFKFQVPEIATPAMPYIKGDIVCNQYPTHTADETSKRQNGISVEAQEHHYFRIYSDTYAEGTIDEWKAYLAAQYAAGTPVQVAYKLKKLVVVPDTNSVFFSEKPVQGGTGNPSPENIRPILLNNTVQVGQTATLTLPETVYGGEVDAVSGEGQETWQAISFDGAEDWIVYNAGNTGQFFYTTKYTIDEAPIEIICSHFSNVRYIGTTIIRIYTNMFTDTDAFSSYLAAQYAAGTPVQIAYKLATPTSFTATGAQPIPALAGVNTVLTDADSATVTGRADPIKRITDLEDAVASQT